MDDTEIIVVDEKSLKKPGVADMVGRNYYGEKFEGFQRIAEIADLIPAFKDYYYAKRIETWDVKRGHLVKIVQGFLADVVYPQGRLFHPYTNQLRTWTKRWDADILRQKMQMKEETAITPVKEIRQIIKVRGEEYAVSAPDDTSLEAGVRTLGGELLNDAMQMLRDDQELEETYDDEVLIKRRNYIVNVLSHATKLVHGKAALLLKASEEKRNTASFLMTLLGKATAGTLSDHEVELLETAYLPKQDGQPAATTDTVTPTGV